ncbi:MAG: hypothetical protein LLG01_12630 [Planctomycetaceae bacterium]|nr:hypothetical protein [Planctomycetaceae bacterium]
MAVNIKSETRRILNDPEFLALQQGGLERLGRLFAGQTPEKPFVLAGQVSGGQCNLYDEPERWITEALDDLAGKVSTLKDADVYRPLSVAPWPYGVHFIDRIFGADVYELDPGNWQVRVLKTPVGTLPRPDLAADPTWNTVRRLATAFTEAQVCVPFYGCPVLSSALNIGLNLYGQELLVAMMVDPEAARRDLRVINDVILDLHRWYRGHVPRAQLQMVETYGRIQPPGHGQICGCSTHLLSPELYEQFIAPLDEEVFALYEHGGMIHLCGTHAQHIGAWRGSKVFRAFQMNDRAAQDFEQYYDRLRDDQVMYVNINPAIGVSRQRVMNHSHGRRVVLI